MKRHYYEFYLIICLDTEIYEELKKLDLEDYIVMIPLQWSVVKNVKILEMISKFV